VAPRKQFLLRIDPALWRELERWAADDLRSVNAQVEWLLRDAVRARRGGSAAARADQGRAPAGDGAAGGAPGAAGGDGAPGSEPGAPPAADGR